MEIILSEEKNYKQLENYFENNRIDNIFVVAFHFKEKPYIIKFLEKQNINISIFSGYHPNPTYEEVVDGIKKFKDSKSKFILAIGGGSAIDVAKCIRSFATMNDNINYLKQEIKKNDIILCAVPTTAGTGSESTKYSVIYYEGNKQSVTSDYLIPEIVLFDISFLQKLPTNVKKTTVLDAFSHCIESIWSVNSDNKSKKYAKEALEIILDNIDGYLLNDESTYKQMLKASNLAGKAINITQTTAGHAMCYKLTSLYNIPHGHAAALINSELLPFMIDNIDKCIDNRGEKYLKDTFIEIQKILKCDNMYELKNFMRNFLDKLDFYKVNISIGDLDELTNSVNLTRLKNNPIKLEENDIRLIYTRLFNEIERRK